MHEDVTDDEGTMNSHIHGDRLVGELKYFTRVLETINLDLTAGLVQCPE